MASEYFINEAKQLLGELNVTVTPLSVKITVSYLKSVAAASGMDSTIFDESLQDN